MPEVSPLNFLQISRHYPELKASLFILESALVNKDVKFDARVFYRVVSSLHEQLQGQQIKTKANELMASLNPVRHEDFILKKSGRRQTNKETH